MLIWFIFFLITYIFIYKYNQASNDKNKNIWFISILFVLIYFAAFRDGLGMDYTAYKSYCERDVSRVADWWMIEPLAAVIQSFCYNTDFSAVIFFLITSIIIYTCCLWVYRKLDNAYLAMFTFVTYTNLYSSSFNLVRQFVAASIILLGTYLFIIKSRVPLYFLFVLAAFFFHKSAAIFIFIYFLRKEDYNPTLWTVFILASLVVDVQPIFNIPIIRALLIASDYLGYLNHNENAYSEFSLSNIYMHAICLLFIWNKTKILACKNKELCIFALKMSVISVICCNFSSGSLAFAYRYAIFCSVFIPIMFSFLPNLIGKQHSKWLVYIPLTILIWNLFYLRQDDRIYCPEKILPIESIYDQNYRPYDNPNVIVI